MFCKKNVYNSNEYLVSKLFSIWGIYMLDRLFFGQYSLLGTVRRKKRHLWRLLLFFKTNQYFSNFIYFFSFYCCWFSVGFQLTTTLNQTQIVKKSVKRSPVNCCFKNGKISTSFYGKVENHINLSICCAFSCNKLYFYCLFKCFKWDSNNRTRSLGTFRE